MVQSLMIGKLSAYARHRFLGEVDKLPLLLCYLAVRRPAQFQDLGLELLKNAAIAGFLRHGLQSGGHGGARPSST